MGYKLSKRFDARDRGRALDVIKRGLDAGKTSTEIIGRLRENDLSYSRSNMLHDIRRKEASFQAKTPESRASALKWHDNVYEPFRSQNKMGSKQASKIWQRTREQSWLSIEDAALGVEFWDLYKEGM